MLMPITLAAAAALALLHIWLSVRVSQVRISTKTLFGDAGNPAMVKRMRAHANFTENAPLFLILLALLELNGGWSVLLWGAAILFVLARLAHAFGMDINKPNPLRMAGTGISLLVIAVLAVWAVLISYDAISSGAPAGRPAPSLKA